MAEAESNDGEFYCIRWHTHNTCPWKGFEHLLKSGVMSDVQLASDDGTLVNSNRMVLATCSLYFRNLIKKLKDSTGMVIVLKDISIEILNSLLDFMYIGKAYVPQNELNEFLDAAQSLQIKGLYNNDKEMTSDKGETEVTISKNPVKSLSLQPKTDLEETCFEVDDSFEESDSPEDSKCKRENAMQLMKYSDTNTFKSVEEKPSCSKKLVRKIKKEPGIENVVIPIRPRSSRIKAQVKAEIPDEFDDLDLTGIRGKTPKSKYKKYDDTQLEQAKEAIKGGLSCYQAGKKFSIPLSTLYDIKKSLSTEVWIKQQIITHSDEDSDKRVFPPTTLVQEKNKLAKKQKRLVKTNSESKVKISPNPQQVKEKEFSSPPDFRARCARELL